MNVERLVLRSQRFTWGGRHGRRRRDFRQWAPIRPPEAQLSIVPSFHLVALFVDGAVVSATEHREIRQGRGASVRPMPDVMTLAER